MRTTFLWGIISLTTVLNLVQTEVVTLNENEKSNIRAMQERFCGPDRMCSKSSSTNTGECRTCPGCRCDDLCNKYGDCCADRAIDLLGMPNFHQTRYSCISNAFKLIFDKKAEFSFHAIQKCALRNDKELVKLCEDPDPSNVTLVIPVETTQDLYKNQFCAQCNADMDFRMWAIKATCTQLVWLKPGMSSIEMIQQFVDDITCAIYLQPPKNSNYRGCYTPVEEVISTCNVTGKWVGHNSTVDKSCRAYSAPIHLFKKTYRNIFCYLCNHNALDDSFIPPPSCRLNVPYPFSVVLDPDAMQIKQEPPILSCKCSPGLIYDTLTGECRPVECTSDRILRDESCFSVIRSANGLVYNLEVKLKPRSDLVLDTPVGDWVHSAAGKLKAYMATRIDGGNPGVGIFRVRVEVSQGSDNSSKEVISIAIHTKFVISWETEIDVMESSLIRFRDSEWNVPLDSGNISFKAEPYWTDPDDKTLYPQLTEDTVNNETSLYTLDFGFTFDLTEKHAALYIADTLKCPRVKITKGVDYTYDNETGELIQIGTNETIDLAQFEPSMNKSGYICYLSFKKNLTDCGTTQPAPLAAASMISPLRYVSLFCKTLALVFLFLTFLIFCIFKELRTLPGKNAMGLILTLFIALMLYTLGSEEVGYKTTCKVIGVLTHFCLLSSFTWMAVASVHMFITLRGILNSMDIYSNATRKFIVYLLISIIVPGFVIGITVAANHFTSDGQFMGYGEGVCFVKTFYTTLLAMGLPIIFVIVLTGSLFIAMIIMLKDALKQTRELKSARSNITTYFKVAAIVGLTWTFALVALLTDREVFKYIFVILCALMGIFVFVCFVCNRTVLGLFRQCCKRRRFSRATVKGDEVQIKMTFNGTDIEIEELDKDMDGDYASIKEMKENPDLNNLGNSDPGEDYCEPKTIAVTNFSDYDTVKNIMSKRISEDGTIKRVNTDEELKHEVDMHNTTGDGSEYGLLMNSTTKEIRDPENVMFNPVFE